MSQTAPRTPGYDWREDEAVAAGARGQYSAQLLAARAEDIIRARNETAAPLFLYLPYQAVHAPLEAPAAEFARTRRTGSAPREVYRAMLARLDRGVGTIVKTLQELGAWDSTLLVFSTDNGGAVAGESNLPLRGDKETLYQGGVRGVAWVAGGVEQRRRGSRENNK